jgi:hypothetical protein
MSDLWENMCKLQQTVLELTASLNHMKNNVEDLRTEMSYQQEALTKIHDLCKDFLKDEKKPTSNYQTFLSTFK